MLVADSPTPADLARVDPSVLRGLVDQYGTPVWGARYEYVWERDRATWTAMRAALKAAAAGQVPESTKTKPPVWLATLVRDRIELLGSRWQQGGGFGEVRLLERLSLVTLQPDDAYVLAMVGGLGDRWNEVSRADQLRSDPELLDRLWRVFEVEGGGEISLANIDKYSRPEASWQRTFRELLEDGTLGRLRVLSACLEALQRDFSSYRAGWFFSLHNSLEPTPEEAERHQAHYRALLRSQVTATVSLAARQLRRLSRAGLLDDSEVLGLRPGLLARTKGAVLDVLAVLGDIAARHPDQRPALVSVISDALEHPNGDVQRAAIKLLSDLGADSELLAASDSLVPSLRRQIGAEPTAPASMGQATPQAASAPLRPISGDDLVERVASLLEDAGDSIAVELVLAGLATMRDPSSLRPLVKRARQVLQRGPREGIAPGWLRGHVARLILVAGGEQPAPLPAVMPRVQFLARRLSHVESVLAGNRPPTTLLGTPSLSDGYLEPAQLIDRLGSRMDPPRVEDLIAALLRLSTEGRTEARAAVTGDDEVSRVIQHALGAQIPTPTGRFRRGVKLATPALWVAASRVRAPQAEDELLLRAGLDRAGQGRPVLACVQAHSRAYTWKDRRGEHRGEHWTFELQVEHRCREVDPQQPTTAGSTPERFGADDLEDWVGWVLGSNPHDLEPALTELLRPVLDGIDGSEVQHDATRVLTSLAVHPGPLATLGSVALAAGMAAHRAEQRVLAVDAVLEQAGAGRLSAEALAAGMASVAAAAQPGRWAASLNSLAQARPDAFVADVLTRLLPTIDSDTRGLHVLIELLLEETVRLGRKVDEPQLRKWLGSMSGSGRGAKAARQLLSL